MAKLSFRVEDALLARFEALVAEFGLNRSAVLRDAFEEKVAELERMREVLRRARTPANQYIDDEEVWRRLELPVEVAS
jgi:predicted DNA-binding protein